MAVYAAMVDEIDQSVGRLRDALEETGQWENTIVVFLSDNGASREGEATGTTDYYNHLRPLPGMSTGDVAADLARLDDIGTPRTMTHYPRGWAMASNTPFRLYKRNTHAGGHQVPCIWHWPAGTASGALGAGYRNQYGHCIDVLPTVLRLAGIEPLAGRRPMQGVDLGGVLADAGHAEVHTEQYYELEGNRGIYRDGWEAVTARRGAARFSDDEWELYDLRTDPTETTDLAEKEPERLAELAAAFHEAALANFVYPMDEGSGWRWLIRPPHDAVFHDPVTIHLGTPTLERIRSGVLVWHRTTDITVDLELEIGDRGVLVSHGDQGGGYTLEVDGEHLWLVHNDGIGTTTVTDAGRLAAGRHSIVLTLAAPGGGRWSATVTVDGSPSVEALDLPHAVADLPVHRHRDRCRPRLAGVVGALRARPPLPVHRPIAQRALRARRVGAGCAGQLPRIPEGDGRQVRVKAPPTFGRPCDRIPRPDNGERSNADEGLDHRAGAGGDRGGGLARGDDASPPQGQGAARCGAAAEPGTQGRRPMTAALMRGADLIGRPVVDASVGEDLAEVKDVMFDPAQGILTGFTLRNRGFLGRKLKHVLPIGEVTAVGTDAVMVAGAEALTHPKDAPSEAVPERGGDVLADQVITESGQLLGNVRDVIVLGGAQPRVVAFEVSGGPVGDGLVPLGAHSAVSGSALIVPDGFEQRIRTDLTGLAAELAQIEGGR